MALYKPQKIYIEEAAQNFPTTQRILQKFPDIDYEVIDDSKELIQAIRLKKNPIGEGKRYLHLAYDKGNPFRLFSEAEQYLACDYYTLHVVEGCDLECSYCILQAYLTNPLLTVFVNFEEMLETLKNVLRSNPKKYYRIGIGQLADALSLDHITEFSKQLVPFFANLENAVLELKTKSTNIGNLLHLKPESNTIVSWSLNAKKIQKSDEHKCADIFERIQTAKKLIEAQNYRLGFHFDPLVDYEGWEQDYEEVITELGTQIPEERIAWISLGCLRMMNPLKSIMEERFPKSALAQGEWIRGMDGKMRYFKPRRIEMYKIIVEKLRRIYPNVTLYLAMESPEVWKRVFGRESSKEDLCSLLDTAGKKRGSFV